jgi:diguanylate cyclase (GGDEF)-like protein/PAS domain S-box-containing protein
MSRPAPTRLLLIEDNHGDARLLREMLSEQSAHATSLTHVECMQEAELHLAAHALDLILLDLGLRDAQGLEAVRRAHAAAPRVPLVVLTGLDDESVAAQSLREGAQDYLVKGQIEGRGLLRAMRYAIERKVLEETLFQEKERAEVTLNSIGDGVICTDTSGGITFVNLVAEKLTGLSWLEAAGRPVGGVLRILDAATREVIPDLTEIAVREDRTVHLGMGCILSRPDGVEMPIDDAVSPIHDRDGQTTGAVSVFRDVSAAHAMERRYRGLLEAAPDAMVVVDPAGAIVLLNLQAETQFGYRRDELIGQQVTNIIPEGFAERLIADDLRSVEDALAQQIGTGIELIGRRRDGSEFPIELMLSPLSSVDGVLVTAAIRDISVRKAAASATDAMALEMAHSAQHDFLTGLPNRTLLNDRLGQAIAIAPRHAEQLAVLFLDLDHFKHINDSLGHSVGDALLQSVGRRLVDCVRVSDTVSRQGGDEFVVLLTEAGQWDDAAIVARRMLQSVAETHSINGQYLHVTASIGVSVYPSDGEDAETLIKNADTAMYQAKENGRQGFQFFTPAMNVRAVERQSVEADLRAAVERREFVLHYQPKINLQTGAITGAEALVRWVHPVRGLVPPVQFIPIAEDSGLIVPIGHWVLGEACNQTQAWVRAGLPAITMAVNVSAIELQQEDFLEGLFRVLAEAGLAEQCLEVEVTESVLMKHADSTASILQALRDRGVRVAVDDFGTGYSSLSYLHRFAVDALKIDQSFVSRITSAQEDASIVTAVISMARSLNLRAVAEGVETREQLDFLQAHHCDEAQGYYFGRPMPARDFAALLRSHVPVPAPVSGSRSQPTAGPYRANGSPAQVALVGQAGGVAGRA